jgi:hypothetical protein
MAGAAVKIGRWQALAAAIAAPLLLYLILRAAAGALAAASPGMAALASMLPPGDLRGQMRINARLSQHPQFPAGPAEVEAARKALAAAPTTYEPFFIASKAEERAGRLDRAIMLMEEVRRRRPHLPSARLQLIVLYGQARRFDGMLGELDMALALNETARERVLPELTRLISDPEGRVALAGVLARRPPWSEDFYRAAKGRKIRPEHALALTKAVQARTGRIGPERGLYLQSLVEAGDFAGARSLWLSGLPQSEQAKAGLVFDGAFRGSRAPAPFNWALFDGETGRAEIGSEGGRSFLDIFYFGGRDFTLAQQRLALAPGRYRLSFQVKSEAGIKSGELSWRLACGEAGADLGAVSLAGAGPAWSQRSGSVVVPAGCSGQRLYLAGTPGDMSAEVRAQVAALEVARGG